jgi:FlaA1/EpsC-like NDP-sugar epimerase
MNKMFLEELCQKTSDIKNEKILIFGGSGSLGLATINRWIKDNDICNVSRDEEKQWNLSNNIKSNRLSQRIGDITVQEDVDNSILIFKPSIICIFACLKHIDICEKFPKKSMNINSNGIMNIHHTLLMNNILIKCVLFVSTDKACLPITTYGFSKAISESFLQSVGKKNKTKWVGVRYGNVLNSSGSVIPYLQKNRNEEEPYKLTHPEMTRFIMTIEQSINLIEHTIIFGQHNEIIVPKLRSMKIKDLFEIFAGESKKIVISGLRCKEKIHEDLISLSESEFVYELNKYYHISKENQVCEVFTLNSQNVTITKDELLSYLKIQKYI